MGFDGDFDRQRKFIPQIKRLLAEKLVDEAPPEEDRLHNTDLLVLKLSTVRVACRVRTFDYLDKYGHEFTLRARRPSGADTELAKVVSGWGDYIFYAIATPDDCDLAVWMLGDLNVFRRWYVRQLWLGKRPREIPNGDRSSTFCAFRIDDLPAEFVEARRSRDQYLTCALSAT